MHGHSKEWLGTPEKFQGVMVQGFNLGVEVSVSLRFTV